MPDMDMSCHHPSMASSTKTARRVLLHLHDGRRVPLEPEEIFLLQARGDETELRTRGRRRLRDVRALGEVIERLPPGTFLQIHRSMAVNVDRVTEIRRRPNGRDWELRLEPPVNRVLPVARGRLAALWEAYGDPPVA
jgi:DNA-binding LytR/AlgR family response regulator